MLRVSRTRELGFVVERERRFEGCRFGGLGRPGIIVRRRARVFELRSIRIGLLGSTSGSSSLSASAAASSSPGYRLIHREHREYRRPTADRWRTLVGR